MDEKGQDLWDALLTSTSGRDGRLIAISIRGDGPMFGDLEERKDEKSVHWVEYKTPEDYALDDPKGWALSNPGLASGIKSKSYMADMARRAKTSRNQPGFRAMDLNQPQEPTREMICHVSDWVKNVVDELPPKEGGVFSAVDVGDSEAMTAWANYWPESGRLEVGAFFPDRPNLLERGEADGVGRKYWLMHERGELRTMPGRVPDLVAFIEWLEMQLFDQRVICLVADRFKQEALIDAMDKAGCRWPVAFRGGTGRYWCRV